MTYVFIEGQTYQTDTVEQIAVALAMLREAGLGSTPVIVSPHATLAEIEEHGDPESYENGQTLFA